MNGRIRNTSGIDVPRGRSPRTAAPVKATGARSSLVVRTGKTGAGTRWEPTARNRAGDRRTISHRRAARSGWPHPTPRLRSRRAVDSQPVAATGRRGGIGPLEESGRVVRQQFTAGDRVLVDPLRGDRSPRGNLNRRVAVAATPSVAVRLQGSTVTICRRLARLRRPHRAVVQIIPAGCPRLARSNRAQTEQSDCPGQQRKPREMSPSVMH